MGNMSDGNLMLLFNVCEERAFVVYPERKNSVLVRECKSSAVYGAIFRLSRGFKIKPVERRKHGELELNSVTGRSIIRNIFLRIIL